jgi:hypothetical protein
MKRTFSSIWRIGIALVLVLGMSLVVAAPAAGDVSSVTVVPEDRTAAGTSKYTITLTTTVDLVADTDTISIEFPTGITPPASISDKAHVEVDNTDLDSTGQYVNVGQRATITVPKDISAGTFDVEIGDGGSYVTNPAAGSYTLKVYTSKEPTAVESAAFIIAGSDTSKPVVASVVLDDYTAGTAAQYTIEITLDAALTADSDNIVITFPAGTTVPTSISSAAYVTIEGNALDATTAYSASGQVVTLTVPENVSTGAGQCTVVFLATAGLKNPTAVGTYSLTAHTSQEPIESEAQDYDEAIVAGAIYKAVFTDLPTAAAYDTATTITIQTQDQYGNPKAVSGDKTFILQTTNTETGVFGSPTVVISNGNSSNTFTYKDTVSGATITAYESPSQGWTDATGTFNVNPQVALYHEGTLVNNYSTIQAAINAAVPGDTIKASAGTYTESITVNKANLTLESTAGMASTFIIGAGPGGTTAAIILNAGADDFTLGGASGKGFTITSTADNYLVGVEGPEDVTISYNKFDTTGTPDRAISRINDNLDITRLTVSNNTFTIADQYDQGIRDNNPGTGVVVGITISNNIFNGTDNSLEHSAIEMIDLDISATASTISGNQFNAMGNGILIGSWLATDGLIGDDDSEALTISGNTFSGCKYGIDLSNAKADKDHNIVIKQNTFTNCTVGLGLNYGDSPAADDKWNPEDMTVKYNDFSGNTDGIYNNANASEALVAQHNYFGNPAGPKTTNNLGTTGDPVSSKVTYSPWLADSQVTVVASGKSQYAISVFLSHTATYDGTTYSGGWNTFSTPIYLDSSADTWGEILALAGATSDVVIAYGWDGTTWTTVGSSTSVSPLNAMFVQMKTAQSMPIVYSTQLYPAPTDSMHTAAGSYTGWELIGIAKLGSTQERDVALASIADKYSQVIDPITGAVLSSGDHMNVGAGYWVFMTVDGTLAGFSTTPVAFVPVP